MGLTGVDVQWDQVSETGRPYFIITLTYRKTNQTDATKGTSGFFHPFYPKDAESIDKEYLQFSISRFCIVLFLGNAYHIYATPAEPDTCCYTKLLAWKKWLEFETDKIRTNDYIFPSLDGKGRAKLLESMTLPRVQSYLEMFTKGGNVLGERRGKFTTHCFRRGGAQHRSMFAKEKWSLKAVKWWGGWSEGERTGTIMRYLLDEFARYESGFSDMLSPDRDDTRHTTFMGEGGSSGEVTTRSLNIELR